VKTFGEQFLVNDGIPANEVRPKHPGNSGCGTFGTMTVVNASTPGSSISYRL